MSNLTAGEWRRRVPCVHSFPRLDWPTITYPNIARFHLSSPAPPGGADLGCRQKYIDEVRNGQFTMSGPMTLQEGGVAVIAHVS